LDTPTLKVECTECHFSRTIRPDDDMLPADVVVEHGRETGHTLTFSRPDE